MPEQWSDADRLAGLAVRTMAVYRRHSLTVWGAAGALAVVTVLGCLAQFVLGWSWVVGVEIVAALYCGYYAKLDGEV